MKDILLNAIAMTLQNTISKLGPIPDKHGDWIKEDLKTADIVLIPALGCYLDRCIEAGNYEALDEALEQRNRCLVRRGLEEKT